MNTRNDIFLGASSVYCNSKKQQTISRSNTEATYKALANTIAKLMWIQSLLFELHIFLPGYLVVWCNNLSTVAPTQNPEQNMSN